MTNFYDLIIPIKHKKSIVTANFFIVKMFLKCQKLSIYKRLEYAKRKENLLFLYYH